MRTRHTTRWTSIFCIALGVALIGLAIPGGPNLSVHAAAAAPGEETTQDIVHLRDGRVLTGHIIEETSTTVVFRYVDRNLNIATKMTLNRADILDIERDVTLADDEFDFDDEPSPRRDSGEPIEPLFPRGLSQGDADDESLPSFYIVPMRGQMGTDIHPDIYREVVADVNRVLPDVLIWVMNCADRDELMISMSDPDETGLPFLDDYRELVRMLHDEVDSRIRQVMWVEDSFGISSLIALAWEDMYMTPGARLGGIRWLYEAYAARGDEDVKAKMVSAVIAICNGFLQRGNRPTQLGEAMLRPDRQLSASWRGREVTWRLDTNGEYIINSSKQSVANFRAKHAEDFGISRGTAETIDDLALLLGYREYRVLEGESQRLIKRYVEDWRRAFENTKVWARDYQQHLGWAQGDETLRWLGRASNDLRRILAAMNRYRAVEIRWATDFGVSKFMLEMQEVQLRERIRALRSRDGGRRGPGGGGGTGPRRG